MARIRWLCLLGALGGASALAQGRPGDMLIEPALYPVVGAPFTALVVWKHTEVKADGTRVEHRIESRVLRDSAGRQRFEDGKDEAEGGGGPVGVRIYDATAVPIHMFTRLDAVTMRAEQSPMGRTSSGAVSVPVSKGVTQVPALKQGGVEVEGNITREPLGRRNIAGVDADGTRVTTRNVGSEGNADRIVTDELWISPLWRLPMLHVHDDGRGGIESAEVTDFKPGEPDAALFRVPAGFTVVNMQKETGRNMVMAKTSPLPSPILDDSLAAAVDRMQTAATAHDTVLHPVHVRYDLRMFDMKGVEHAGVVETWTDQGSYRYEAHTDGYDEVRLTVGDRHWEKKQGIGSLRITEFEADQTAPAAVVRRLLQGGRTIPKLRAEKVGENALMCAGDEGTAVMCFNQATGFVVSAAVDKAGVIYEGWKKVGGWTYRPSAVRVAYLGKLAVEGKMTVAETEFSPEIFKPEYGMQELEMRVYTGSARPYPVPLGPRAIAMVVSVPGSVDLRGTALVHVWMDDKGKVLRAVVEDADSAQVGQYAQMRAGALRFAPEMKDGRAVKSEAAISVEVGPIPAR